MDIFYISNARNNLKCDAEATHSLYFQSSSKPRFVITRDRVKAKFLSVSVLSPPSKELSGDRGESGRGGERKEQTFNQSAAARKAKKRSAPTQRLSTCGNAQVECTRGGGEGGECRSGCENRSWPRPERGGAGVDYFQRFLLLCKVRESVGCLGETSPVQLYASTAFGTRVHPNLSFANESSIDQFAISNSKYT